jgi:hypothetical protein
MSKLTTFGTISGTVGLRVGRHVGSDEGIWVGFSEGAKVKVTGLEVGDDIFVEGPDVKRNVGVKDTEVVGTALGADDLRSSLGPVVGNLVGAEVAATLGEVLGSKD